MKFQWLVIPGMILCSLHSALAEATLKVGDPAPAIKVAKWLKGQPVEKFGNGSIYVVEFWATWCGPCRKSAPHLSELAKKYQGKAQIIGVSIWESEKTDHQKRLDALDKFVTSMGDKMDYTLAADDNDGTMGKTWMEAADERGIPTAFIIGKDGKIAWIGYPWDMDDKLEAVVAGTLDTKAVEAEAAVKAAEKKQAAAFEALLKPVGDLKAAGKGKEAIEALDKIVAEHPEVAAKTGGLRYKILLDFDEPAAYAQARKLMENECKDNPGALYMMARDINEMRQLKQPDRELAVTLAKRAVELRKNADASTVCTLAEAYFLKGDLAKAVETSELAVQLADKDADLNETSRAFIKGKLNHYKAQQAKAASPAETP